MLTILGFYLYPNTSVLKTLATTCYALLVYYILHVASPRINKAKYFIISHVACKCTCLKNTADLVLQLYYSCQVLSEHDRSGTIGLLKARVRVSDVVRYHNRHLSTIQRLRDRYQATRTVKDRRRSGQPRMATGVKSHVTSIV